MNFLELYTKTLKRLKAKGLLPEALTTTTETAQRLMALINNLLLTTEKLISLVKCVNYTKVWTIFQRIGKPAPYERHKAVTVGLPNPSENMGFFYEVRERPKRIEK